MKILVINNDGGGFADYVEVSEQTTVRQLFADQIKSARPEDYLIRVNRQPVHSDQLLQAGDRVSFTPTKIQGAALARTFSVPQRSHLPSYSQGALPWFLQL